MDFMFGDAPAAAPAAAPSMFAPEIMGQEDNSLIEEWERKKRQQLQQRREESAKKKSVAMEAGQKALEQFESKRKVFAFFFRLILLNFGARMQRASRVVECASDQIKQHVRDQKKSSIRDGDRGSRVSFALSRSLSVSLFPSASRALIPPLPLCLSLSPPP